MGRQTTPFDNIQLEAPIASGPYLIDRYDVGRSISYRRNPDYWGDDVPSRRGMFNFGRIVYRFYKDDVARLEAFKAGEFDVVVEYSAKNWARSYNGPKFDSGEIIKRELTHSNGAGMQGFVMNLRRAQFQDIRVRQALGLALDFEWMNRQLFYGQYKRIYSFFNNSELAATGLPSEDELKLLEPLRTSSIRRCSARRRSRRPPIRRFAARQPVAGAALVASRPAGTTVTAPCAMPRASRSL